MTSLNCACWGTLIFLSIEERSFALDGLLCDSLDGLPSGLTLLMHQ